MSHWSQSDINFLKQNYYTMSCYDISKIVLKTPKAVKNKAKYIGCIKVHRYKYNEHFFDAWSRDMAYMIGFITADGCVNSKYTNFRLCISDKDIEIIQYFCKYLCPNLHIYYNNNMAYITVSCPRIVNHLYNLDIVHAKTGFETLPKIPDEFFFDYLRGYFDGDGSIYVNITKKRFQFFICSSSFSILNDICKKLRIGYMVNRSKYDNRYKKPFWAWVVTKKSELKFLYDNLYNNETFALQRKKNKFVQYFTYAY